MRLLSSFWHNFKRGPTYGVPEGEEKEQEIGNLFEKITKENFPNLVKEIGMQVQEAQTIPNKLDPRRTTLSTSLLKCQRLKIKRES